MPYIKITVANILAELDITKNKLAVEAKIRPNTISDLVSEKAKAINFETLERIVTTLNELADEKGINKRYNVEDIFRYISEETE
ncbi:helix-turn-helix domain-containing protein [Pontibacillus yanchengensis]|uniref:Helix-turn-helix domain-containing protein n=1 Tax=Pontibacillus yanchengensis TaxID=462910 RepID=A0ACC7VEB2_9BACI|nr:helix-turn-helix transcriptional regulator [Pontibacillus yanchengensis]MYL53303.1 helix-turn-helix domain-containing protein [Pontibacillus yanchengensis]